MLGGAHTHMLHVTCDLFNVAALMLVDLLVTACGAFGW